MLYHPDKNAGNAEYENKFKEIAAAYEVLSDVDKKYWYDLSLVQDIETVEDESVEPEISSQYVKRELRNSDVPYFGWKMAALVVGFAALPIFFLWILGYWDTKVEAQTETYIIKDPKGKERFIEADDPKYDSYMELFKIIQSQPIDTNDYKKIDSLYKILDI